MIMTKDEALKFLKTIGKMCKLHTPCDHNCPFYGLGDDSCPCGIYYFTEGGRIDNAEQIPPAEVEQGEIYDRVNKKLADILQLFEQKNDQYATSDPFANFTAGGNLLCGSGDMMGRYEALKAYVLKHIAHVYNNNLRGNKVKESINDIIVYFIIASIMADMDEDKNEARAKTA